MAQSLIRSWWKGWRPSWRWIDNTIDKSLLSQLSLRFVPDVCWVWWMDLIIFEWWNSYNKMMNRLTTRLSNSLYIFSKSRTAKPNFLPLYQSAVFKCTRPTTQPMTSMTSSPAASPPSDTSRSCPLSSPAYHLNYAAIKSLPPQVSVHFSVIRPQQWSVEDRNSTSCWLSHTRVSDREHHSLVI